MHPSRFSEEKLLNDCKVERTRRGGPGGQHRNKVESAIVITHLPTGIIGQAGERRSQHANREVAIERLRLNLAVGFRVPVIKSDSPSELWISRSRGGKLSVSISHEDFPGILSEALDCISAHDFEVGEAAKWLGISTSQLVKLLKQHRPAFEFVNRQRHESGLGKLR